MNQLSRVFNNQELRIIEKENNELWFVAKDVCDILEIKNSRDAVSRLDDDEKGVVLTDTPGGRQKLQAVNEFGLYNLVLTSRKPEAKEFKRWITHEVIPSIRKHGAYMTPETIEKVLTDPDTIIKLATNLKEEQEKRKQAEKQLEEQKPKVIFAEAVETSKSSVLVGELAKILNQNGVDIGQNRLFKWLRDNGYLIRQKGENFNLPTQYSMDLGLFEIKKRTINNPDGSIRTTRTPKVTGKGQIYFVKKFLSDAS